MMQSQNKPKDTTIDYHSLAVNIYNDIIIKQI